MAPTLARLAFITASKTVDEEEFLRAIMMSESPLVSLRDRIDCAKALLTARRFAKEEKPDPKLIDGGTWTEQKAARLELLRREFEKKSQ